MSVGGVGAEVLLLEVGAVVFPLLEEFGQLGEGAVEHARVALAVQEAELAERSPHRPRLSLADHLNTETVDTVTISDLIMNILANRGGWCKIKVFGSFRV